MEYSREKAMKEGILIDVTAPAREIGIDYPVAFTKSLWEKYIKTAVHDFSPYDSRIWAILQSYRVEAARNPAINLHFSAGFTDTESGEHHQFSCTALVHTDKDIEPVITIMLPDDSILDV